MTVASTGILTGDGTIGGTVFNSGVVRADNLTFTEMFNAGVIRGSSTSADRLNGLIVNAPQGQVRVGSGLSLHLAVPAGGSLSGPQLVNLGTAEVIGGELAVDLAVLNATSGPGGSTGLITGRNATLRFGSLFNGGAVAFTGGVNDVWGDIENASDGVATLTVTGGATAVFYDDIVQNGTFRVSRSGTLTSTAVVLGGFTGSGGATGGGNLFLEGDLRPGNSPGDVLFETSLFLGPTAVTVMELAGLTPGTEHDRLTVTGDFGVNGTLRVALLDGFLPGFGDTFELFRFNTLTGTFHTLDLPTLAGGLGWNTGNLYTLGTISVVPEPTSLALVLAALVVLTRRCGCMRAV